MFNKKLIAYCSLILLLFIGAACQKKDDKQATNTSNKNIELKPRPPIDAKKDYTSNISGNWIWTAEKDGQIMGMGGFNMLEEKGEIKGYNRVLVTGLKPIEGKGGRDDIAAAIISVPLRGIRDNNAIKFEVVDQQGNITKNTATLIDGGKRMQGSSISKLSIGDKITEMKYSWNASRTSG